MWQKERKQHTIIAPSSFITQMNLNACTVKIIAARLSDPFMINTILNGVNWGRFGEGAWMML
jgi:hypothetical protein